MTTTTTAPAVTRAVSGNFPGADATVTDPETDQSFFAHLTTHADDDGSDWQLIITSLSQAEWCSDEQEALERAHAAAASALGYGEFNSDRTQRGMILTGSAPFDGYVSTWLATPPTVSKSKLMNRLQLLSDGLSAPFSGASVGCEARRAAAREMHGIVFDSHRDEWTASQVRLLRNRSEVIAAAGARVDAIYGNQPEALVSMFGIQAALTRARECGHTSPDIDHLAAVTTDRIACNSAAAAADAAVEALFAGED